MILMAVLLSGCAEGGGPQKSSANAAARAPSLGHGDGLVLGPLPTPPIFIILSYQTDVAQHARK